jgi:hypothetical protein
MELTDSRRMGGDIDILRAEAQWAVGVQMRVTVK